MGKLLILCGPSAGGKSVLQKALNMKPMITVTTRAPRPGEVDGVNYYFKSKEEFNQMVLNNEFAERTDYVGKDNYGTLKSTIEEIINGKDDALAVLDANGVRALKELYPDHVHSIYIGADLKTIKDRLIKRGSSKEDFELRYARARDLELTEDYRKVCDMVIWNNDDIPFEITLHKVQLLLKLWEFN